jgi:hypothetical protein
MLCPLCFIAESRACLSTPFAKPLTITLYSADAFFATLSVKIPDGAASGSKHTIASTDVEASNLDYDDVVGKGNSQTITVVSSNNYFSSVSIT